VLHRLRQDQYAHIA